ncbi:hypothetical protein F3157_12045 [Virgibacillus dakarensis]|uniref:YviE n=1 Tax=Lentibacillus populi TaxID=1827502 RepID=A0A9W5U0E4_9BACI|nr:DUF6470 family protein [Lentibacillus populi]MTW86383.1 hypothetical protein [Virgibacillus dakarensis]GGB55323.1 hypothetical protein GCM10011409_36190 [Lentibacillus populi]
MQLPQIRMTSQMAQIRVQQTAGQQELRQPEAELSIQQPNAEISMKTTPSKLTIDQRQAWEDMDLMPILKRIEKFASEGQQGLMEGIKRRVQQGNELMEIENKRNPVVSQAIENGYDGMKTLGIKFIPSSFAVKMDYQSSNVQVDVKVHRPIINAKSHQPIHRYERGNVTISMKQYQDLNIDFVNLNSEALENVQK